MTVQQSYYEVLGLDQQATADQVKAAYQKLVLTLHPDKAGDQSPDQFQLLQQAYQVWFKFPTAWPAEAAQQSAVEIQPSQWFIKTYSDARE
jgi:hypothetical protein